MIIRRGQEPNTEDVGLWVLNVLYYGVSSNYMLTFRLPNQTMSTVVEGVINIGASSISSEQTAWFSNQRS
jgi:hypothetical protein